jgi:hypothetical protein
VLLERYRPARIARRSDVQRPCLGGFGSLVCWGVAAGPSRHRLRRSQRRHGSQVLQPGGRALLGGGDYLRATPRGSSSAREIRRQKRVAVDGARGLRYLQRVSSRAARKRQRAGHVLVIEPAVLSMEPLHREAMVIGICAVHWHDERPDLDELADLAARRVRHALRNGSDALTAAMAAHIATCDSGGELGMCAHTDDELGELLVNAQAIADRIRYRSAKVGPTRRRLYHSRRGGGTGRGWIGETRWIGNSGGYVRLSSSRRVSRGGCAPARLISSDAARRTKSSFAGDDASSANATRLVISRTLRSNARTVRSNGRPTSEGKRLRAERGAPHEKTPDA